MVQHRRHRSFLHRHRFQSVENSDERIAGTWRDIPNLHRNAVQERRYVMAGIALIFVGYSLQILGYFLP